MLRNRVYFLLKPFIPRSVRLGIRRWISVRKRVRTQDVWPIMPGSERAPIGWPGWPGGKKFALVLTHDVEGPPGLANCRQLMTLERELGFRSSFNFVPEGSYQVSAGLREELVGNGFEVGVHDLRHDGRLYTSRSEFSRGAVRINHYVKEWGASGFRSGFMLHQLDWLHDLDVQYDSSTFDTDPFEPQPEGRHTIFPFWVSRPFPLNSAAGYIELPYTLPQDSTLFLLLREKTIDIWLRKLDWIAQHGGMALIDTHPDYMSWDGEKLRADQYSADLYREFLNYVRSKYADAYWPALPREVAAYVKALRPVEPSFSVPRQTALAAVQEGDDYARNGDGSRWRGKRAAVLLFSYYPVDPRPLRAAEAFAGEGVAIDLFCLKQSPGEASRETINGVNVFRFSLRRERGGRVRYVRQYATFILRSFFALTWRAWSRRYSFVHVHNMPDVLVFSAIVPKLLGAKIVLDLHDPMPELMRSIFDLPQQSWSVRLLKKLEKWSIGFSDAVLTVNLACKRIYSERSCPPEKITVVMNAPNDELFPLSPPAFAPAYGNGASRRFIILYHGSLVPRNGFDLAVYALESVRKTIPEAQLLVCGEHTAFLDEVMALARDKGLSDAVQYLGMKNRREIVEVIQKCDVGIIPNHRNVFTELNTPTRIFECLTLGKPVIAPRAAGIRDYFGDDDLIFFELGDAADLASKIQFAFSHPDAVKEVVRRGQEVYRGHTWSREKSALLNAVSNLF